MSVMVGATGSSGWEIREENSYDDAVLTCGGHEFIDEALCMVDEALLRNPLGFSTLHDKSDIRYAKTKLRLTRGDVIPALTLFFFVNEVTRTVVKLHVKFSSPDSMAMAQNPWDDNEPHF